MRGRTSASCFWASDLVSALEKCASGIVDMSRCGLTKAVACGMATCEWMSMVVLFGRTSRPGLPCLRAAVAAYLFHCWVIAVPWFSRRWRLSKHTQVLRYNGVGEVEGQLDVLLDQHDRLPLGLELRDGAADLGHQLRREPFGGLVHQQHARIAHECAADREHLLLAAGQRAGELGVALGKTRKELE